MPKSVRAAELRTMTDEQLRELLRENRETLFRLRVQAESERLDTPSELKRLRREIARILTVLRERELAAERGQS